MTGPVTTALDMKIGQIFDDGVVVRKDLVSNVKGNAVVPSYVLEYLLAQYCATTDEATMQQGIETVRKILIEHYVHRAEAELVRSKIREKRAPYKVIDRVSVSLNQKTDAYEASFSNLGIKGVPIDAGTVKRNERLLVTGVWCLADVQYDYYEEDETPWKLEKLKPIQMSSFDHEQFLERRKQFTTDEWIGLLLQSIGFQPDVFPRRIQFLKLARLIPFCERNYNLVELGPKGTGKSHIYSEFSPHGMLISGGEVTIPKLFVNNANGKLGLVGYWDVVAFDEFAGKEKRPNKALVDIMKGYMANKTFSRGTEPQGAQASMVFVGNTQESVPHMLKHSDLFDELPPAYHDSAFLDRIHLSLPGWEIANLRKEMFTSGYGFVVDYLAEVLRGLRDYDFAPKYKSIFTLHASIATRDRDAIDKTFSGMMKLLYPHGEATEDEIRELLTFAIEGRKRVKDQLMRFDSTFDPIKFAYTSQDGKTTAVYTLEEQKYPEVYWPGTEHPVDGKEPSEPEPSAPPTAVLGPTEGTREFKENITGIDYDLLFADYLRGAKQIEIVDPFIRKFHQARNFMEFVEMVGRLKDKFDDVSVHLTTKSDPLDKPDEQEDFLNQIKRHASDMGIRLSWNYSDGIHDRFIRTNTGWKIVLGRGLDIFNFFDSKDVFNPLNRDQKQRTSRGFHITWQRIQ